MCAALPRNPGPPGDDPALSQIVDRLVRIYHPERIYLFGSVARGEAGAHSDYDLMVVVADDTPAELRRSSPAYRAIWRLGTAADILVYRRASFQEQLQLKSSLPSTVVREGRLLYAA